MTAFTIRPVTTRADIDSWIAVPERVFADDRNFIPPLRSAERRRIHRQNNPFFRFSEVELFVAYDANGAPVGRVSAQVNRRYLAQQRNHTGHFGFFESIEDTAVSAALLDRASDWLRARGMRRMEGPFNLSINEECGLLIDGFDTPPAMLMPHSRRWQCDHAEAAGLTTSMTMHTFRMDAFRPPEKLTWLAEGAVSDARVTVRPFQKNRIQAEIALMVDIFNDAWSENWGFVPLTAAELEYAMHDFLPFLRGRYGQFVSFDDQPVGFILVLPNVNDMITDFGGALFPLNWLRLGVDLTMERFNSWRMPLLGLRRKYQGSIEGTRLLTALFRRHFHELQPYLGRYTSRVGHDRDFWIDLSWVLETNKPLLTFLRSLYGKPVKTYRIYGKDL